MALVGDRSAVHAGSEAALLASLAVTREGLSEAEAAARLRRIGPNRLRPPRAVSAWQLLVDQLRSVVVVLLIAAAVVSFALGERIEAAAITAVLVINTVIGFVTELRAHRAMASLLQLDVPRAFARRDGRLRAIDAHDLVPGDVIELNAGQHVPADGRILDAVNAHVDEAALTGESMPVAKRRDVMPQDTPLADRANMVHKGTTQMTGTARVLVTATGMATEVGRIGELVDSVAPERTPLERRLDTLGHRLVWFALAVAGVVAALGLRHGMPWPLVFETAIALAVAAVPEALPAVATIALAVGVHRMARRNALVRRLPAVESLGATTVVCTDKTRTLTSGDMRVVRIWADGDHNVADEATIVTPALRRAIETAVLASRDQADHGGDPVDTAMLACGLRHGVERSVLERARPFATLVPFSSEQKFAASFHQSAAEWMAFVKGAPSQVLKLCARGVAGEALDEHALGQLMAINDTMAGAGLRVIALASGAADAADVAALHGLQFDGFAGLIDPPAPGVKETIARLRAAGLRTVMLTGDQRLTALAVGQDLGLLPGDARILDGRDLLAMRPGDLAAQVGHVNAYSRVTPADKLAIVSALRESGEIVAMLGDGVNDAAALKRADIGVSMGQRGTDVAKEASSIILQDDRFETVAAAVEEGRVIFDNIRKFVFYLFSCNVAEILVLLIAGLAAWPVPLLPLQLLWVNIVTDTFPALALAMEPGDPNVMQRAPRDPRQAILSRRFLAGIMFYAVLIAGATLAAFHWALAEDAARAQTVAFMTLALSQAFHLGNARSRHAIGGAAHLSNPYAIAGVLLAVALQLAAAFVPPLAAVLHVVPLAAEEWAVVAVASMVPAVAGQALKSLRGNVRVPS